MSEGALLEREALLGALWRDGLALAEAAERAGLRAPVTACPGWEVADLVWHVGEVHEFWRQVVANGWTEPDAYEVPDCPADAELVAWYRAGVDRLVQDLGAADPATPVWSWAPRGHSAGWVVRRMAQETGVHRWDAEAAAAAAADDAGVPPVDAALASDGIDELLDHFCDTAATGAAALDGTVHLHCTDVPGEWLVEEPEPGGRLAVRREHAKGDAALRGPASDLLLVLWRRLPLTSIEVLGDVEVARRLLARTDLT